MMHTPNEMRNLSVETRDMAIAALTEAGIREPDRIVEGSATWKTPDGKVLIFRAHYQGSFGSLDVMWTEGDDVPNGLWSPVTYDFLPWLARDVKALLAAEGRPSRELLASLGKRDPQPKGSA